MPIATVLAALPTRRGWSGIDDMTQAVIAWCLISKIGPQTTLPNQPVPS
jgi:hypothetical protein